MAADWSGNEHLIQVLRADHRRQLGALEEHVCDVELTCASELCLCVCDLIGGALEPSVGGSFVSLARAV